MCVKKKKLIKSLYAICYKNVLKLNDILHYEFILKLHIEILTNSILCFNLNERIIHLQPKLRLQSLLLKNPQLPNIVYTKSYHTIKKAKGKLQLDTKL